MHENPWKFVKGKRIYDNPWITLEEDEVINPGGGTSYYGKVLFKNYAIGIVPVDEQFNTWLVGQWRYTLGEYSWEIPMGGGPVEEDRMESARRELKEETGISAVKWEQILKMHTSNSVTNEVGYAYLAQDLSFGETEFEETEKLDIKKLPLKTAVDMCYGGEITDSLSMIALMKADRILSQRYDNY